MNAKRVNAVAALICRSMENGRRTPAGWAMDLESAGLLQSPESAAETQRLRAERDEFCDRVDTLTAVAKGNKRHVSELFAALQTVQRERDEARARVAELEAERHTTNEALDDAVQALRANRNQTAPSQVHPGLLVEQSHQLDPADAAFAALACACPDGCSRDADYPGWTVHPGGGAR